jgi:hypothetical protein
VIALQELEHWAVLVFEKAPRDVHVVVCRDPDEVLIERSMMD